MVVLLSALCLWGAAALFLTWYGNRPLSQEDKNWNAIIVPGCRVLPDGRPSIALALRVRRAVDLYDRGFAPLIVLTGGVGDAGFQESEVAADFAQALGVPHSALRQEGQSTSTEENARFSADITPASRVLLVTDAYHVFRTERVFARFYSEVRGVGTVNPYRYARIKGATREVLAIIAYALLGRLTSVHHEVPNVHRGSSPTDDDVEVRSTGTS